MSIVRAYGNSFPGTYDRILSFGAGFTIAGNPNSIVVNNNAVNTVRSSISSGQTLISPSGTSIDVQLKKIISGTGVTFDITDNSITINSSSGGGATGIWGLSNANSDNDDNVILGAKYNFYCTNNFIANTRWEPNAFTGSYNVIIGNNNPFTNYTSGNGNVCIGNGAGAGIVNGNNNVVLGTDAGNTLGAGGDNIVIGIGADMLASGCGGGIAFGQYAMSYSNSVSIGPSSRCNSVEAIAIGYHATANMYNGFYTMGTNNGTNSIAGLDQGAVTAPADAGKALGYNSATGQIGPIPDGHIFQTLSTNGFGKVYWGPEYMFVSGNDFVNGIAVGHAGQGTDYIPNTCIDFNSFNPYIRYSTEDLYYDNDFLAIRLNQTGYYEWNISGKFSNEKTFPGGNESMYVRFGAFVTNSSSSDIGTQVGEALLFETLDGTWPRINTNFNEKSYFYANSGDMLKVCTKTILGPGMGVPSVMYFDQFSMWVKLLSPIAL